MPRRPQSLTRLSASSVSARVAPLLEERQGTVIATFARSCYLDVGGRIVAVVAAELLNGPLNIVISLPGGVTLQDVPVGADVAIRARTLLMAGRWLVDATAARVWEPQVPLLSVDARTAAQISLIWRMLETEAPAESFARTGRLPGRAAQAMSDLAAGLRGASVATVVHAAQRLAGLGQGLTPSGDDVLAGALLAIAAVQPAQNGPAQDRSAQNRPIRDAIVTGVGGRTTRISASYLEAAASGEAGEAWHQLVDALPGDLEQLPGAIRRVMTFGETSGADMLAGFALALDALQPG